MNLDGRLDAGHLAVLGLKTPAAKTRITIRIDDDLLQWFRKQVHGTAGGSYQTLINAGADGVCQYETRAA